MMRFIRPTQFQLRLGWLSITAVLLGPELLRFSRDKLGHALLKAATKREGEAEAQAVWLSDAGLLGAPQGRMSPRAQADIARMGELYGIYDTDAQTLTDLGQVLLAVEPWRGKADDPSPFCWTGAKRFVGLRVVLGANGDMVLALLRRFPSSGKLAREDAMSVVAGCVEDLSTQSTHDEERAELARQSERLLAVATAVQDSDQERYLRGQHVHPQLEPLRELGYLHAEKGSGDYVLTEAGERLKAALPEMPADALLEEGLSRVFFAGEGIPLGAAARWNDLRAALRTLPVNLHAELAEAPLEPVVLLTQSHLIRASLGSWIDLASAKALIEELGQDSRGAIGLKLATAGDKYNLTWTSPEVLSDETLWAIDRAVTSTDISDPPDVHRFTANLTRGRSSAVGLTSRAPAAPIATPGSNSSSLIEMRARFLSTLRARTRPPNGELHLRLWLKYLSALLDTPASGGVASTSFGGPRAWLETLLQYLDHPMLDKKRAAFASIFPENWPSGTVIALAPLRAWLNVVRLRSVEPIQRCVRLWADARTTDAVLRGEFLWAVSVLDGLASELAQIVEKFLVTPADRVDARIWEEAQEATRALVEDAVHRGYWRRDELRARLQDGLTRARSGETNRIEVACALLADLTTLPDDESFTYDQEFSVPRWLVSTLEDLDGEQRRLKIKSAEVELSWTRPTDEAPGASPDIGTITATVTLSARTPVQGWSRGEEYAHDALSRLRFLAQLRCAGGLPSSTEQRAIEPGIIRFARGDGSSWERSEAREEVEPELEKADALGFVRVGLRPHECRVQDLPGLAMVDRGKLLDGRARLTRALHWLSTAEDRGERPGERLSHAWVALEHLVTDGGESKLPVVLESVPSAIALCHLRATFGAVYRDALASLHILACEHAKDPIVANLVDAWLGPDAVLWYASRPEVVSRFKEDRRIDDEEGLRTLSLRWSKIDDFANAIEGSSPFVSDRLRRIARVVTKPDYRRETLQQFKIDAACLLTQVYDVRNQLVHDANPFGFDDAYRWHVLYDRYRALIDPVVAEVLRIVLGRSGTPLAHAWSLLRARFAELVDARVGASDARIMVCLLGR